MATPEGKVKKLLREEMAKIKVVPFTEAVSLIEDGKAINGYYFMPQATGQGEAGIADFVMCVLGQYMEVEVKADGGTQSKLQKLHSTVIHHSLGEYFLVEGKKEARMFANHLEEMIKQLQHAYIAADQIKQTMTKIHVRKEEIH